MPFALTWPAVADAAPANSRHLQLASRPVPAMRRQLRRTLCVFTTVRALLKAMRCRSYAVCIGVFGNATAYSDVEAFRRTPTITILRLRLTAWTSHLAETYNVCNTIASFIFVLSPDLCLLSRQDGLAATFEYLCQRYHCASSRLSAPLLLYLVLQYLRSVIVSRRRPSRNARRKPMPRTRH